MPDLKISDMDDAQLPLDGTELVPLVQNGFNVKTTTSEFLGGGGGGIAEIDITSPDSSIDVGGSPQSASPATFTLDLPVQGAFAPGSYHLLDANVNDKGIIVLATDGVVSAADIVSSAANKILGAQAAGPFAEITVGTGLAMFGGNLTNTNPTPGPAQTKGTFLPNLAFGGASVGITYNSQTGTWTRIGDMMFIDLFINLSSIGSSTGAATITNMPVIGAGGSNYVASLQLGIFQATVAAGMYGVLVGGGAIVNLQKNVAGGSTAVLNTDFLAASNFHLSLAYKV